MIWAIFTGAFAFVSSYHAALPILAVNGLGLALVIPNVQSLIADYYPAEARGRAFGALWLTISLGGMLGALFATNMGKSISSVQGVALGPGRECVQSTAARVQRGRVVRQA